MAVTCKPIAASGVVKVINNSAMVVKKSTNKGNDQVWKRRLLSNVDKKGND